MRTCKIDMQEAVDEPSEIKMQPEIQTLGFEENRDIDFTPPLPCRNCCYLFNYIVIE